MAYRVIWEGDGVHLQFFGNMTPEDIAASTKQVHGDERFDSLKYQVINCVAVEKNELTVDDMTRLAHLNRAAAMSNPKIRQAIVAVDEGTQALVSLYEYELDGQWQAKQFESLEEARAWLAL